MDVSVYAPAKINLTLDVTGRREDGYHLIETVMQTVSLCDKVTVWKTGDGAISLEMDDERLPVDRRNTAYRAAEVFFQAAEIPNPGVGIRIQKRIPMQAGLAGGSADAAGVLVALNRLTDRRLDLDTLCEVGGRVGADVPFCVAGGASLCTGTGTILSPLSSMPNCYIVIAKPVCGVSTQEAYSRIDRAEIRRRPHTSVMADALLAGELDVIGRELCNVFEEAITLPEVASICAVMREHQTMGCMMSGSGSAVFGLFEKKSQAMRCGQALHKDYEEVAVCRPFPDGPTAAQPGYWMF